MKFKALLTLVALLAAACDSAPPPAAGPAADITENAPDSVPVASPSQLDGSQEALRLAQADTDAAPASSEFKLGTHYERLSPTQPTSSSPDAVEVAELFWYGCPHCNTFEPYLERWQRSKATYISFVRIPAVWNALLELHARAFYTAEALGKVEEMHSAFFREIHENANGLDSEAKLTEFFGRFGVDAETFKKAFDSFDVHSRLQRANELARRYRIDSVPSIVVNGKYKTNGTMAGGYDNLVELIDELAASERAAN